MQNVVVVESPAKAKTINKYLGGDYTVIASYGHVRDLPAKDGSVEPASEFAMKWTVDERSEKQLRAIGHAVKGARTLFLATDPDREGEAISWHVLEELARRGALNGIAVKRVVFSEITKRAVLDAMAHPRDIDNHLVDAYKARRALDYLVGFTLSPVLWRKLPGSRSAGRVQSVALRLVCEREQEIETFLPREYWTLDVRLANRDGVPFSARLIQIDGRKLEKFDLATAAAAHAAKARIDASSYHVETIDAKQIRRNPPPPFTTSTLQQEASRKLRFSARRTMQTAQRLYEGIDLNGETVGLITYMRTDGVQMAGEAVSGCRTLIGRDYGSAYLPPQPRMYKSVAKNAQEAHEAIRPTDPGRRPEDVARYLDDAGRALYELIWKRAIASQMESARLDQVGVDLVAHDAGTRLRAVGTVVAFDGFLRLYQEGEDETADERAPETRALPRLERGEAVTLKDAAAEQHFTQPPPRYTEASLVKKLEELGIGRPSTYASILSVLQDRNYVRMESRHFVPEDRGRLVTAFLVSFFARYVEYGFTAHLEEELDDISAGKIDWKNVLDEFWAQFSQSVKETETLRVKDTLEALDALLAPHIFPRDDAADRDPRACPACGEGRLSLKLGKFGPFVGCSNYPDCRYTRPLVQGEHEDAEAAAGPKLLGHDPESGDPVTLRKGPYGYYVQRGEAAKEGERPKRSSLAKNTPPQTVDLDQALKLLALPREIGLHPETGKPIYADRGRFGPYIRHERDSRSLAGDDDVLTIGLNRAVALLAEAPKRRGHAVLREVGADPESRAAITVRDGRYGPYIHCNGKNAPLPKGANPETLSLEAAVAALAARAHAPARKPRRKSAKAAAKKPPRKSAKKAPPKPAKPATEKTAKKAAKKAAKKVRKAKPQASADDGTAPGDA